MKSRKPKERIAHSSRRPKSSALKLLLNEYMNLRKTNQSQIAKRIGRSQSAVSHLMRAPEAAGSSVPSFGLKPFRAGEESILRLVAQDLKIPVSALEAALAEDILAYSIRRLHPDWAKPGRKDFRRQRSART